ncbi:FAD:protein FMN transferase [Kaistia algarum]|uniref:FAD:protein FMN transferase n=1 Tax=Kaistia algarum TaxID=2083279 RepID=UPI00225AA2A5|nr:FAD:protein FMN transferase [Kaistia algarum]MCX5515335.1 FAD:protein FMN transferase [Kaistia algarum]
MMGMPITIEVVGAADRGVLDDAFAYFDEVDRRFSTYKADSEIEAINRGYLPPSDYSAEMREVLELGERTRIESDGFFDIRTPNGALDPSGIVKGWAIRNAARRIAATGAADFFVDAGGDIQSCGRNASGDAWSVGIRNPFSADEIIKVVQPRGQGIATSGSYVRGHHIRNPHDPADPLAEIVSLTVIGPDVLEADRFATAAFAMGRDGIYFIEARSGLEGYLVDRSGRAILTTGFGDYCAS